MIRAKKEYIYKGIILVQDKAYYSCKGCFFDPIKFTTACCQVFPNKKFLYPCNKNIIYIPKTDDKPK